MTEFEKNALGMSYDQVKALIERNKGDEVMLVASILSDCQEMLERDQLGVSRSEIKQLVKSLNVAKYILFETQEERV